MSANRVALLVGGSVVGALVAVAVLAPVLAPYDPKALAGPSLQQPSARHLLGTNELGQDLFSQLLWSARSSLAVAVGASSLAVVVGGLVGVGAALLGRVADTVAMRTVDTALALPGVPMIIVIAAVIGPQLWVVIAVIGLIGWPLVARAVRSQTLSLRQRGFVAAAHGFGASPGHVLRRHLLPALAPVVVARFLAWIPVAIFLEAGLAFLGLGDPLGMSWGLMLNRALTFGGLYFTPVWVWWVAPAGLAIAVAVLGFTALGVGVESRFNLRAAAGPRG